MVKGFPHALAAGLLGPGLALLLGGCGGYHHPYRPDQPAASVVGPEIHFVEIVPRLCDQK